jgi:hypothetical protein
VKHLTAYRASAILATALGLLVIGITFSFEFNPNRGYGNNPAFYPRSLGILMLIMGVTLFVWPGEQKPVKVWPGTRVAVLLLLCFGYAASLPYLGYLIGTCLWLAILCWALGETRWSVIAAISVLTTLVTHLAFTKFIYMPLPEGLLSF